MQTHPLSAWKKLDRYETDETFRRRADLRINREEKFARQQLFNLDIEVTSDCNLACKTCYNPKTKASVMQPDQFVEVLEKGNDLSRHLNMDGIWITVSGGEPTFHPNLWEMLRSAREQPFIKGIAIITNGTLIDRNAASSIASLDIDEIMISLDGATAGTNDAIRGKGTFEKVMATIETIKAFAHDIFLGSTLTLTSLNLAEVEAYVKLIFDKGFNYAWINPPLYAGRLPQFSLGITYDDHLEVMKLVRHLDVKYFREAFSVYYNIPYYPITDPISPYVDLSTACPWGKNNLTITSQGDVLPCLYSREMRLGNIFRDSLVSLYANKTIRQIRDGDGLAEPCRSCQFRSFCGGCRARTFYLTQDWAAADPWCPLVRQTYVTKEEEKHLVT